MLEAHIDSIRRTPAGLRVEATFACGHRYETVYPRESSARRASRAQIARWELSAIAATGGLSHGYQPVPHDHR